MIGTPIGGASIGGAFPLARLFTQALQATLSLASSIATTRVVTVALQAMLTLAPSLRRLTFKRLAALLSLAPAVRKLTSRHLAALLSLAPAARKIVSLQLVAAIAFAANFPWRRFLRGLNPWGEQAGQGGIWTRQSRDSSSWE